MEAVRKPERAGVELDEATVREFASRLRGPLIMPDDPAYEEARKVYNAMIDKHPVMIAQCVDAADVMTSVNFARDHDLLLAVRGGKHNVAGLGVCDGGLVIDLSMMKNVRVDPEKRTARVGGGATWGDVDHATHVFGLAAPGGLVSTTGVGGLTLGGGFGYLTRRYGLSCDNVISADVVTADGRFLVASEEQNQDLFWAIRGGGGNFGVVTSFEFKLHPVDMIYGGPIFYPIEMAEEVLRFYREFITDAPEDISVFVGFHLLPPAPFVPENLWNVPTVGVFPCYTGPMEKAEEAIEPLRQLGEPLVDLAGPMPFPAIQSMFDPLLPPGLYHYWKADFLNEITDESIPVHLEYAPNLPTFQSVVHIYPHDGAVHKVGENDTAYGHRGANFSMVIAMMAPDPSGMDEKIAWTRNYWSAMRPYSSGASYVNFLMEEGQDRIRATYGDNYDRLTEIKAKYDPQNLFRVNQNIRPKD